MITKFIKLLFFAFFLIVTLWLVSLIPYFNKPSDIKGYFVELPQKELREVYADTKIRIEDTFDYTKELIDSSKINGDDFQNVKIKNDAEVISSQDTIGTLLGSLDALDENIIEDHPTTAFQEYPKKEKIDIIGLVDKSLETLQILGE